MKQTNEVDVDGLPLEAFIDDNQNDDDEHSKLRLLQTFAGAFQRKNSYARCFLGNHHKLYIDKKVIKCRIR